MNILDIVAKLCAEHNITLTELERRLGFGQGSIGKWKDSTPKVDKIIAIANYFHVSTDYIMGISSYDEDADNTPASSNNKIDGSLKNLDAECDGMVGSAFDIRQINDALILYQQYQNAAPEVRSAVEILLRAKSQES